MRDAKTGEDVTIEPYDGPAGGWGSARSLVEILTREGVPITGSAMLTKQNKPDGFMCTSCAWAKPAKPLAFEYCENGAQGDRVGADPPSCDARLLRRPHRHRVARLDRLRPGGAGPADRADALRPRQRPLCSGVLGRGVVRDRTRVARPRSEIGRVLRLGPRIPGDELHVGAAGPDVRQQQPPRFLEHVPRADIGGSAAIDRLARRHGAAGGFRDHRPAVLLRPERRLECTAHAASAARGQEARRLDHHLQSLARARAGALHRPAIANRDGDEYRDPGSRRSTIRSRPAATSPRSPACARR